MRMPIEDMQGQVLRMQEKNIGLVQKNEKVEAQMRYLGKRYTAALIARFLANQK